MRNQNVRMLCEGALCVALSLALSFAELDLWFQGGSISVTMLPLVLFAIRWGAGWGVLAGLAFGTLKYFMTAEGVINWVSILFDYSVAYAMVGLAGLFKRRPDKIVLATAVGAFARFIIHYISGVTVYAEWMPDVFWGMPMTSPFFYSALYNGGYVLPSAVLVAVACFALTKSDPVRKWLEGGELR